MPGFNLLTQVCQEGQASWRVADEVIEIKAYFSAPPRGSSLAPQTQPELPPFEKPQMENVLPSPAGGLIETLPNTPASAVVGNTAAQPVQMPVGQPAAADGLRQSCV